MNAQRQLDSDELRRGQAAVERELQEARAHHAKTAYTHAMNRDDDDAKTALIASKQRLDLLQAELQGLAAATTEAERLEHVAGLRANADALERSAKQALETVDAVETAFAKVQDLIASLGVAYKELEAAEVAANSAEAKATHSPQRSSIPLKNIHTSYGVDALLWLAIGSHHDLRRADSVMDMGGTPTPDGPARQLAKTCEKVRDNIQAATGKQVSMLRERANQLG